MSTVVCAFDDLAPSSATRFDGRRRRRRIVRIGDDVYAIGDVAATAQSRSARAKCLRREGAGVLEARQHVQPVTGEPRLPATQPVPVFVARVVDGYVKISMETAS